MTSARSSPGCITSKRCVSEVFSTSPCEESRQMCKQLGPASGARIAGGNRRDRQRPVDREVRVVVRDGQVRGGIVRAIDPIANVGSRAQRLEAVQEARRNVQMPKIFVVEQECLLLAESGRVPSNINEHVVYGAVGAADKLR